LFKPSLDEWDDILFIATHDRYKSFARMLESIATDLEDDVLKVTINTEADKARLIQAKLRAEGARKLLEAVSSKIRNLKNKQDA
jgi:hypothetical protein